MVTALSATFRAPDTMTARTYAYARVSTVEQLTENQRARLSKPATPSPDQRFIEEKVSGQSRKPAQRAFEAPRAPWSPAIRSSSPS